MRYFSYIWYFLRFIKSLVKPNNLVSTDYIKIDNLDNLSNLSVLGNSWKSTDLPSRQRILVDQQLMRYRNGKKVDVFNIIVSALKDLRLSESEVPLLEIGCSSGYYSEVFKIAHLPIKYSGCDYSESFIQMAQSIYPSVDFSIEDATSLTYPDSSFDIVISGGCLLHIPEYQKAVFETARVAKRYVVFHRTPVVFGMPEQWYRKKAYDIETIEIHFNEQEFLELLNRNNLTLLKSYTVHELRTRGSIKRGTAVRTYVCEKKYNANA
jgi:2-polyprenyl-3-methyl-5-hydroxy-6-metoxy-1,4-benzoquinol methylase